MIAGGVVLNPAKVIEELNELASRNVEDHDNLKISDRTHVIFPWHFAEDCVLDRSTADGENIGTTQRGIGPCYRDKVGRSYALRMGDLYRDTFRERVERITAEKNRMLSVLYPAGEFKKLDAAIISKDYAGFAERLQPYVCDTTELLLSAVEAGKRVLFEGAQGALLDVDHGTYPFVTSSNSSGVGIANGSGVPGRHMERVIGIVKAYSTRVGGGPFPTEQDNDTGQYLRDRGNEYGTVTRRPRRCGWLDAVAIRYTARLSGVDEIAVMLLDVVSGLEELKVCTSYDLEGKKTNIFPSHVDDLRKVVPVYETIPGWSEEVTGCRTMADLPLAARNYLDRVEQLVGRPITMVSVGPDREQTITS